MRTYCLDHLSDPELLHLFGQCVLRERAITAELLAAIARDPVDPAQSAPPAAARIHHFE